ncbi:proton-conducting transporter membrane subunit [Amylibacter sp. IMCC11727]|uniref:proton-conducting transporter transmembrane domain-containing protein n=1 Tax=Amylibacter sp. IMCC11727 TaxID=3039851 RepID=UPI00244DD580|nr:proton-conducting transporter membrane subunit [Amylibacter sp. IMCC11727]WGI23345.1 proton-conducting transporter membrane subunit [Amylibacter sp. IMCC11727]
MELSTLIFASLILPTLAMFTNLIFAKQANLRDTITFAAALATFAAVVAIALQVGNATTPQIALFEVFPNVPVAFNVEPLGLLFALVASGLWIVTHIYAIGYMRGNNEKHHARFFGCFAGAIAAALGIAWSSNMFTLFLYYEILTISTYPLVVHKGTPEAIRGARTYLGILLGTSIALQLTAVIWTYAVANTLDFQLGGILRDSTLAPALVPVLLALYAFGIGKAALMPFHRWLPAAMVAPTPVSALLHAVAVVKAGVFTMLKVGIYIFGIDFLSETGASEWLMWLAAYTIIASSVIAMQQDNLKKRLAYSTVSQLSYITLGMALATQMGALGGGLHIAMHAMGKITLFMCAGAIYVATHKTEISQMTGLGRTMPITFAAFGIGALSIIGLPPLGGSWSKWYLMVGAADAQQQIMIAVLMLSSLLNVAYLLPVIGRGFYRDDDANPYTGMREAPLFCWLPPALTAFGCLVLFFTAGHIIDFLMPITGGGS